MTTGCEWLWQWGAAAQSLAQHAGLVTRLQCD
jgi:hypothetical protein